MTLRLTDIVLTYPDGDRTLTALDHVSLAVAPGEFAAVVGPSGSGKSSLLAVAATLITPDEGTVSVAGQDVSGAGQAARTKVRRDHIGIVFQQANLLPSLTTLDQLLAMAHLAGESPARPASAPGSSCSPSTWAARSTSARTSCQEASASASTSPAR